MTDSSIKKLTLTAIGLAAFVIIIAGLRQAESFVNPLLMALFISIILAQPVICGSQCIDRKYPGAQDHGQRPGAFHGCGFLLTDFLGICVGTGGHVSFGSHHHGH